VPLNFLGLKWCREPQKVEKHWFRGSVKIRKVKHHHPSTTLLQEFRGPPVVRDNTLGFHGNYFDI